MGSVGRTFRYRLRSSFTQRKLGVEPLLPRIERGQLKWLGLLCCKPPLMPHRRDDPGLFPPGNVKDTMFPGLGTPSKELEELLCCPSNPNPDKRQKT